MSIVQKTISTLANGNSLDAYHAEEFFDAVFAGEVSEIELASVLMAMRVRGESCEEIVGAAKSMRKAAIKLETGVNSHIDTCGTGGDNSHSFNVSSAAALVSAAAGIPVVKHGNRSVTSKSGSADFFEALGIPIALTGEQAYSYFKRHGFVFLFAPLYHPAMKHAAPVRKALAIRTIFNFLGPLTNPSFPQNQMIGVYSTEFMEKYATATARLGYERVLVYSSEDGMDEVSPHAHTHVYEIEGSHVTTFTISPDEFISKEEARNIPKGLSAHENVQLFIETITTSTPTAVGKFIALNAALAMYAKQKGDIKKYFCQSIDIVHGGVLYKKVMELKNGATARV
ncbi:MAG: anthranilate phosphoribosyltransferase [Spirochaetes bacterium]|nr:anthranilate phosphoribosyltransferase [Spirochaetota bacterium]